MSAGVTRSTRTRVFITTDTVGGVWTYSIALAAGFAAQGIATTLAVLGPAPSASQRAAIAAIPHCDLTATGLPLEWALESKAEVLAVIQGLQAQAADSGSDSVHLHSPSLAFVRWLKPTVAVAHSCMATWWKAVHGDPMPAMFNLHAELVTSGLGNADAIAAPTKAFRDALHEAYGVVRSIEVVHNGLEQPPATMNGQRGTELLFAGRLWDEGKNISLLSRLARTVPNHIRVAGPRISPSGSQSELPGLHYLGNLAPEALRHAMSTCAAFISTALYEPFGLSVLEAAQLGTPLLLSDIPSFRELWTDAALFVSLSSPSEWVTALEMLMADTSLRARLGQAASLRSRLYSRDRMVNSTIALHRQICPQLREAA